MPSDDPAVDASRFPLKTECQPELLLPHQNELAREAFEEFLNKLSAQLGGYRYFSGLISSQPSFAQTYGYFEMRAKIPRGKGLWPAFWMLPADFSWPPELDVMESIGDPSAYYTTAHSAVTKMAAGLKTDIAPDAFHTFAVAWDEKQIVWYVDGREVNRQPTPPDMHKPMYLVANLAVGGNWPGSPDGATRFPARMTIDYIRAYRFAP